MTEERSHPQPELHDDPLARALDTGHRVAPDARFRAELRERLMSVGVPPPTSGSSGAEVPWMPVLALAVGAIVVGVIVSARSGPSDSASPAPASTASPTVVTVPPAGNGRSSDQISRPQVLVEPTETAPTEAVVAPQPRLAAPEVASTEAGPVDLVAIPSASANPTEDEEEEEAAATSLPSPSPTPILDPESPPTAVATSTPGATSLPRPTATPVAPTPGVPGG